MAAQATTASNSKANLFSKQKLQEVQQILCTNAGSKKLPVKEMPK